MTQTTLNGHNRQARDLWVSDCNDYGVNRARDWRTCSGLPIDIDNYFEIDRLPPPQPTFFERCGNTLPGVTEDPNP